MKIYLVGGAVRDQLLDYPSTERDWVVVGATPDALTSKGYKTVGNDFPVFLHPKTHEEYALARTERKKGRGYRGFVCDFSPNVSLEEDLSRRDLTINAMALDDQGNLIDPYQGQRDLALKILRHVSPAFIDDPVRVLRVARFAARYHHLGFTVADETRALMYQMAKKGELEYLVPERVWQEWQRSLLEKNPEVFITTLRACGALHHILPELNVLFGIPNSPLYHPEIDTGIHGLMSLSAACHLSADPLVRFAATTYDLGKACTPYHQWPSHPNHDLQGESIVKKLCERLRIPTAYRQLAMKVARYHLIIHRLYTLSENEILQVFEVTDAFRRPELFDKLLLTSEADVAGSLSTLKYTQVDDWRLLRDTCAKITTTPLLAQGFKGVEIKTALHQERLACIRKFLDHRNQHEK